MELFKNETVSFSSDPINCNICLKTFAAKSTLELHKEINHEDNRNNLIKTKVIEIMYIQINDKSDIEECNEFEKNNHNLKPKNKPNNSTLAFEEIKFENSFYDGTLACDDSDMRTHSIILPKLDLKTDSMHENQTDVFIQVRDEEKIGLYNVKSEIGSLNCKNENFCLQVRVESKSNVFVIKINCFKIQVILLPNQNKIFQVF